MIDSEAAVAEVNQLADGKAIGALQTVVPLSKRFGTCNHLCCMAQRALQHAGILPAKLTARHGDRQGRVHQGVVERA